MRLLRSMLAATALTVCAATPASALNIILNADASFRTQPNGAAALFAFQKAANYWNQTLTNNTTLYFDVSYAPLASGVLGSTGSNAVYSSATDVYAGLRRSAQAANGGGALDQVAVANLRPLTAAGGVNYRMPAPNDPVTGFGVNTTPGSVFDNNNSANNLFLYSNTASNKVLGVNFTAADTDFGSAVDARITFSSNFAFDFDPTDGITTGTFDFVAVAIHEMGHALGFTSGTDLYDFYGNPNGPGKAVGNSFSWQDQPVLTTLDLFRYSANAAANGGFGTDGQRVLQLTPNRGAFFSVDALNPFNAPTSPDTPAAADYADFSTGRYNGDGQQASHWKDSNGFFDANNCFVGRRQIGIMDPTAGSCSLGFVTSNDLAAFDAIGYNLNFDITKNAGYTFSSRQAFQLAGLAAVPEPGTWAQMIFGTGLIGAMARRLRRQGKAAAVATA